MSEQTGLDVAEYIKNHCPATRVILITGHKLFEYAKSAIDNNVCYFLIKPYDPNQLIDIVNEITAQLNEEIKQSRIQTSVYFNNWHHLKRCIVEMYNNLVITQELSSLLFCTYTKSADSLLIKIVNAQTNDISTVEQIGEFDSSNLSSFVVSKNEKEFTCMLLYSNEEAANSFLRDMKKHAGILGGSIKIHSEENYQNIYEMIKVKVEEAEKNPDIVELAKIYIEKNFSNPELSLETIASNLHISKNYLGTLLKRKTGVSYNDYLMNLRMKKAANLLSSSGLSVKKIAISVGFRSTDYFRKNFREKFGDTPTNWRRNHINK